MTKLNNTLKCYLEETRSLISDIRKSPDDYRKQLRMLSMTKDNSHLLGYENIFKLYKALEDIYKALLDEKLIFSKNLKILITIVLDEINLLCNMIEKSEYSEKIDIRPYVLYCDKAVAGEIFEPKHLLKFSKTNNKLHTESQTRKQRSSKKTELIEETKKQFITISSESISSTVTLHEDMIARSYIINNQVSMLKNAIAENDMRGIKEAYKLLANDTQTLQNSLRNAHETLVSFIQDDSYLKSHQAFTGFFVTANDKKFLISSEYIHDVICESPLNYEVVQNQKVTNYVIESETGNKEDAEIEQIPVYSLSSLFPAYLELESCHISHQKQCR